MGLKSAVMPLSSSCAAVCMSTLQLDPVVMACIHPRVCRPHQTTTKPELNRVPSTPNQEGRPLAPRAAARRLPCAWIVAKRLSLLLQADAIPKKSTDGSPQSAPGVNVGINSNTRRVTCTYYTQTQPTPRTTMGHCDRRQRLLRVGLPDGPVVLLRMFASNAVTPKLQ